MKALQRALDNFARKQVPFAVSTAINATLKRAQEAERENMRKVLDRPTPFTLSSVAIKRADKRSLTGVLYVKDIAAAYLLPFEKGGTHKLIGSGRTWLNPKDKSLLNKYGNFSAGKLASMRGRADTFVGSITTKTGETISGLWQRPVAAKVKRGKGKAKVTRAAKGANTTGKLKLLMRFGDAMPVKQQLNYRSVAAQVVAKHFRPELEKALAQAMATARR
ncbi:hypothetical protein [Cupriavidus pauculus]|uniref:hypothetical protein n=1 Tax=Cupriavidus pauculus TaxID=82633 RepID=UPI001EE22FD4|nr:hypothetical protein [Cupriavidus pauculus]GJG92849.1 hypothetical protein CBA19C6_00190 [Cupriavidus pauculus]